jgi:uncharacterized SAM-binding protein YcdF (DUF218 family)
MPKLHPSLPCLVVLGARINPEGRPGRIARMRVEHALTIWREAGATGFLVLTGGCSREGVPISEARAMADYALARAEEHGGRELRERLKNCLLLEESSLTTWDSACHTLPLLLDLEIAAVGLISDALHLRRAHFLFRRHYRHHPISLHPLPVPGVIRHYWRHRRFLWLTRMILRETGAWVKFLVRIARDRQR